MGRNPETPSEVEYLNREYRQQFERGWDECKKEVLRILNTPLQNLDLSEDWCDERYITQIEKL